MFVFVKIYFHVFPLDRRNAEDKEGINFKL
jgi:hypothetical protein